MRRRRGRRAAATTTTAAATARRAVVRRRRRAVATATAAGRAVRRCSGRRRLRVGRAHRLGRMRLLVLDLLLARLLLSLVVRRRLGGGSGEMLLGLVRVGVRLRRTATTGNRHGHSHRRYKYSLHSPPFGRLRTLTPVGPYYSRCSDALAGAVGGPAPYFAGRLARRRSASEPGNMRTIWAGLLEGGSAKPRSKLLISTS